MTLRLEIEEALALVRRVGTEEAMVAGVLLRHEIFGLEEQLEAAREECLADINCGVDCDCYYDDDDTICLAHRVLDALGSNPASSPATQTAGAHRADEVVVPSGDETSSPASEPEAG